MLPQFAYSRPQNLKDAVRQLTAEKTYVHAGGTDLLGCLRDEVFEAQKIVSISGIAGLHGITEKTDSGLSIGALTTITEVAESPAVKKRYAGLASAASEVASPQLRNQGTIGGNLCQKPRCWYYRGEFHCLRKGGDVCYAVSGENQFHCIIGGDDICFIVHSSDTAPALLALNAYLDVAGPNGKRRLAVADLHVRPADDVMRETWLDPGEIVTAVHIPAPPAGLRSSYRKVRARRAWDFALAGVALAIRFDGDRVIDARVVLSGAAPVPWRSKPVEEVILGKRLSTKTIEAATEAVVRDAQPLEKNAYKLPLFKGVIMEELTRIGNTQS